MTLNSTVGCLSLLASLQFLLMHGEYFHRSITRKATPTAIESSFIELWISTFCFVNLFIMAVIWVDLYRQYMNENQLKSQVNHQSAKLSSNLDHLSQFRSSQSYDLLHIRRSTTQAILNEIIRETRCTRQFTIATKPDTVINHTMSIYIEAIQSTRSLIIVIDYDHARDVDTKYASIIRQIFSLIFRRCNLVQTWGNLCLQLKCFLPFGLFIDVNSIDRQQSFREWYNRMFNHQDDASENMDAKKTYHSCPCTFREYQSNVSRAWSLSEVIALCFNEYLDVNQFDVNHCLAITKLSNFLRNPLSHEQFCH